MQRVIAPLVSFLVVCASAAQASSHREAPFITRNPKVDGTDFYLFSSYESGRSNFVTLIANYQPLQDAYGGPNYFSMDPNALYEIHVDNTGDAVEDITFQFRFQNTLLNDVGVALPSAVNTTPDGGTTVSGGAPVAIPLINAGTIGLPDGGFTLAPTAFQGQRETYTVTVVRGPRRTGTAQPVTAAVGGAAVFAKPLDNIGTKTFPGTSYANYARAHVYDVTIPGCTGTAKLFVGQRAEGFAVNLGAVFDLVNAPAALITSEASPCTIAGVGTLPGVDGLSSSCRNVAQNTIRGKNVTTLALEVPTACLNASSGGNGVIGGWTTASVRQARVVNPTATYTVPAREGGAWTQVSRLGNPLVNEVVIGVDAKDRFNASEPKDDAANFAPYVLRPTLPVLLQVLFGVQPPKTDRGDLVAAFLTGINVPSVANVNQLPAPPGGQVLADMLRLNTAVSAPFTPRVASMQNNLGAMGCFLGRTATAAPTLVITGACDASGFPNGRRPGDDVVDIALRVTQGALLSGNDAPSGSIPFHDGVLQDAQQFDSTFPYLKAPNPGS
ncbi:MAG: DUF4331 domain-containing protein [Myxococcaceae bacterium]|nr:DUF4331 domain-containing protein [Myxococcaceae bacterium]MCA3016905.1 DUF4331 domain-containing protein [Myxococcaceae bacterium]